MNFWKDVYFVFLFNTFLSGFTQDNSLFPITYFDHKAQNNAVITAKYSELVYHYTRDAIFNNTKFNTNIDTAIYFVNKALISVDSVRVAALDSLTRDSTRIALIYLAKSELKLQETKKNLLLSHHSKGLTKAQNYAEKAIFNSGSAISDAYTCSLYFIDTQSKRSTNNSNNPDCPPCPCDEPMAQNTNQSTSNSASLSASAENTNNSTQPDLPNQQETITQNQAQRLEVDEATLTSIKAMYEKRMADMQNQIDSLKAALANAKTDEEKQRLQSEIDKIEGNKSTLSNKREGAEEKLKNIRTDLDQYYAKNGQKDKSSSPDQPQFAFDKDGFYNDANPIPIDQPIPNGLIYSIQLGVYSKLAMPEIFKGLYPLDGQTVGGDKYRYRTGIFYSYSQAADIKNKVWDLGLKDAFIIAYQDGKPIAVSQAVRLEK